MPAVLVRDKQTGQEVAVDSDVLAANPGDYELAGDQQVNVDVTRGLGAAGSARSVAASELQRSGASALTPEEQAARTRSEANRSLYGGAGSYARQGFRGLLSGGSFGISELALRGDETALEREALLAERDVTGPAFGGGELIGDVGSALLSGGTSVAGKLAGRGTLSGFLAREGERLTGRLAPRLGGVGASAAGNAFEGAISATVQEAAEQALSDRPFSGEALLASGGRGLLLGGAIGGGAAAGGKGLGALLRRDADLSPTRLADALDELPANEQVKLERAATGEATAAPETAAKGKRSLRSVVPLDERSREAVIDKAAVLNSAIEEQAGYARSARRAVEAASPTLAPRAAAELRIAEQAYRDAVALTRREFRDFTRSINRGEVPALAQNVDGAAGALKRLEDARTNLDAKLSGAAPSELPSSRITEEAPAVGDESIPGPGAARGDLPEAPPASATPLPDTDLPPGFVLGNAIREDAPVKAGMPGWNEIDMDSVYVVKASDIADRVRDPMGGAGKQASRTESIVKGWDEGRTFTPIDLVLRKDGTLEFAEGRHRFDAALKTDRDIPFRLSRSTEDMSEREIAGLLGDAGNEALERDVGRIERVTGKEAPDWVRKGLARRRTGPVQEQIVDTVGGKSRGISPRSTDRIVTFGRGAPNASAAAATDAPPPAREQPTAPVEAPSATAAPAAMSGVGDAAKALDAIMPGLPPPVAAKSGRLGRVGGAVGDAAALLETAQGLGMPVPSLTQALGLGPLGKLFAAYRVGRMAMAKAGFIRGNELAKTAGRVTGIRDDLTRIARSITERGLAAVPTVARATTRAAVRETKSDTMAELREVQQLARKPEAIRVRIEADSPHAPAEVLLAAAQAAERKVNYLAKVAPQPAWSGSEFAERTKPTDLELERWNEIQEALDAPVNVISDLARGVWSPDTFEAVASVYPGVVSTFARQVMDRMDLIVEKAPRETRLAIGEALGLPLDGTQLDWYGTGVAATDAITGEAKAEQRASSYMPSQSKVADLSLTGSQRRAMR